MIARPLEEVGGALENAFAAEHRTWRLRRVERHEGWFRLERKRIFRPDVACRLVLISTGTGQTALEVEAATQNLANRLGQELIALAKRTLGDSSTPMPDPRAGAMKGPT